MLIESSDHLIQFLILEGIVKERTLPGVNLYKRDFNHFHGEFEEVVIQGLDWDEICGFGHMEPGFPCNNFIDTINCHLTIKNDGINST